MHRNEWNSNRTQLPEDKRHCVIYRAKCKVDGKWYANFGKESGVFHTGSEESRKQAYLGHNQFTGLCNSMCNSAACVGKKSPVMGPWQRTSMPLCLECRDAAEKDGKVMLKGGTVAIRQTMAACKLAVSE